MSKFLIVLIVFCLNMFHVQLKAQSPFDHRGKGAPGVQQIVMMYGEQLNLTEEQKLELISKLLNYRNIMQKNRMQRNRTERSRHKNGGSAHGAMEGNTRDGNSGAILNSILNDQQKDLLRSLMNQQAEYEHEYRLIRNRVLVEHAGLSGDKADEVRSILNRHSELRKEMRLRILEDSESSRSSDMGEMMTELRTGHETLRSILTVEEFQKLMQVRKDRPARLHRGMYRGYKNPGQ